MKRKIKFAPSLERADWLNLEQEIHALEQAGADMLHLDIMDRTYGETILFSPRIIPAIKQITNLPLDIHMYVSDPKVYFDEMFQCLNAHDYINLEMEAVQDLAKLMQLIREGGSIPAISIDIQTPVYMLEELVPYVDMVNVIIRSAGCRYQPIREHILEKIAQIRKLFLSQHKQFELEVDGSINFKDSVLLVEQGADILVLGTKVIFRKDLTYKESCQKLRSCLECR